MGEPTTSSHLQQRPHVGERSKKGRSKSMDTSNHFGDESDHTSNRPNQNRRCERPINRSTSTDGSFHIQSRNRFDAMLEECQNLLRDSNMGEMTLLARTKSPRRPERQPSWLPHREHKLIESKNQNNADDTPVTATVKTSRRRHRHASPSTKQEQQQQPLPPLIVYIQKHLCEENLVGAEMKVAKFCGSSSMATQCHSATSPRRPTRQPSCVLDAPVPDAHKTIPTNGREMSPRRPMRRPSIL